MQVWQIIAICVAVVIVAAAVGWYIYQRNRSRHLRDRFGPEYDRRVIELGDRRRAESELARTEHRVRNVRPLQSSDRLRFLDQWRLVQARFVDDPAGAVEEAEQIVVQIMRARGYATENPYDR